MLTEEQVRSYFGQVGLIPQELTQFDIKNEYARERRPSNCRALGDYTRVDTVDGTISVKIRGSLNLYEGYEVPLSGGASPVAWQVGDAVTSVTLTREDLTLQGEGLSIHISPSVHLGGSGNSRRDVLPLNVVSALIAFTNMSRDAIYELFNLVSDVGKGRSMFIYSRDEYRSRFPGRSAEEFWQWSNNVLFSDIEYPSYSEKANGWRLSRPPLIARQ